MEVILEVAVEFADLFFQLGADKVIEKIAEKNKCGKE